VSQVKKVLLKVGNLIIFCKFIVENQQLTSTLSFWYIYFRMHEWTDKNKANIVSPQYLSIHNFIMNLFFPYSIMFLMRINLKHYLFIWKVLHA